MSAKLVVVVGETASGKTELAIRLAQEFDGEIIAADSRTVYKGMDIVTAKPTAEERAAAPHHLIDVVEPTERFTVADFKRLAEQSVQDISNRGKLPILVGGTGLYVDALLFDYQFPDPPIAGSGVNWSEPRPNTLVLGLKPTREELKRRIETRFDAMLDAGLVGEVKELARLNGWEAVAMRIPAHKALRGYIEGTETLEIAKQKMIKNDLDLAKRQRTWFKRNKSIQWISTPVNWSNVVESVTTFLDA